MMNEHPVRASDRDRERTVDVLREAYAAGCLDRRELEERCSAAYSASMCGDLRDLTADLPASPVFGPGLPADPVFARPRRARLVAGSYEVAGGRQGWPLGLMLATASGSWLIVMVTTRALLAVITLSVLWVLALCGAGWRLAAVAFSSRTRRTHGHGEADSRTQIGV
jgi:hypothetical protein